MTVTFTLNSAEAAQTFLKLPWHKIFKHVSACEGPNCFAEIDGGACGQALSLATQFIANPENYFSGSKKVVVPIPFDFFGKNAWPLDMSCENFIKIELGKPDNVNFSALSFFDATVQMRCFLQDKPTRRIVVPTKPESFQILSGELSRDAKIFERSSRNVQFSVKIDQKFTSSTKVRYVYVVISDAISGETYKGGVTTIISIQDKDVTFYGSKLLSCVEAWKCALCDHVVVSNAAEQLSNIPAYVWTCNQEDKCVVVDGFGNKACKSEYFCKPNFQIQIIGKFDLPAAFKSFQVCVQAFIVTDQVVEKVVEKVVQVQEKELTPSELTLEQIDRRLRVLETKK